MSMKTKLKKWWDGEFIPYDNDDNSGLVFTHGTQKRHWTSRLANAVWGFLGREWKWVCWAVVAIIGLTMSYIRLF